MKVEKTRKKKRSVEDKENTSQHDGSDIRKSRKAKKEVVKEQDTIEDEKKSTKKKKKKEIEVDDKLQGSDGAHKVKKAKNDSVKEQPRRPRTRSMDAMDQNEKNEPGVNDDMQNGMVRIVFLFAIIEITEPARRPLKLEFVFHIR